MRAKLIKTEADYKEAVARIEELMDIAAPVQEDIDELELLGVLVDKYEEEKFPMELPTPIDAILFRMDQQGLRQVDLVPFIGSRPKVSEVLSGKRQLSLRMIRKLHAGLGIPAEVLLKEPGAELRESNVDWLKFPIAEMRKRGWFEGFSGTVYEAKSMAEELITEFARPLGMDLLNPVYCRQQQRTGSDADGYALAAWRIQVCRRALEERLPKYERGTITPDFARQLVELSYLDEGPLLAREYLNKSGIHLIVEKHLPKTYLDGASMIVRDNRPLIALTLRHDRLDHFWFTLFHELGHVKLHLENDGDTAFFDNLEDECPNGQEEEADRWAMDALVDPESWENAGFNNRTRSSELVAYAQAHRISPAIPAGRLRKETNNYTKFHDLVGNRTVRKLFAPNGW